MTFYGKVDVNAKINVPINMDLGVKEIIQNDPATVIIWDDGVKTVVKRRGNEPWDAEKGIALCYMKRICGNNYNWYDTMLRLMRRAEGKRKKDAKKVLVDKHSSFVV